jgi:hypothetical protein
VIVSHEHRFIFIKTRKTGGTSIEALLERHAGPDAIVTPLHSDDVVAGHRPRNWHRWFNPVPELFAGDWRPAVSDLRRRRAFWNHMTAAQVRARIGVRVWDSYYKFCFERDPWEKVASYYFWQTRSQTPRPDFARWVLHHDLPSDWHQYTLGAEIAVDFVGRFEKLAVDLRTVLRRVGLPIDVDMPRLKTQYRPSGAALAATPAVDERIATVFRRELTAFAYTDRRDVHERVVSREEPPVSPG